MEPVDRELEPFLVRDALRGLDHLLAGQRGGGQVAAAELWALIHLVRRGAEIACAAPD
ncbi:MAG TPA: hypothetical protein VF628_02245 [Allosphingosinicella sp.]|jgi:hypothetical protein